MSSISCWMASSSLATASGVAGAAEPDAVAPGEPVTSPESDADAVSPAEAVSCVRPSVGLDRATDPVEAGPELGVWLDPPLQPAIATTTSAAAAAKATNRRPALRFSCVPPRSRDFRATSHDRRTATLPESRGV